MDTSLDQQNAIVHAGFWRTVLLGPLLLFAGLLFLFIALAMFFIPIDNAFGRLGLWLLALGLALLGVFFLLMLTTLAMRVEAGREGVFIRGAELAQRSALAALDQWEHPLWRDRCGRDPR
jgi:hypothetical protein